MREEEAIHNTRAAREKAHSLVTKSNIAFSNAIDHPPKEISDAYYEAGHRYFHAANDVRKAEENFSKDPSSNNQFSLALAQAEEADAGKAYDEAWQNLIVHFTPEDREAWDRARTAAEQALQQQNEAEAELRAAQNDLGQSQRAAASK